MAADVSADRLVSEEHSTTRLSFARAGSFKRRMLRLVLAEHRAVRWITTVAVLESLIGMAGPWLSAQVIDTALPDQASNLLAIIVGLVVVAALHAAWAGWLREKAVALLTVRLEAECLTLVLERFLNTGYHRSSRRDFGGLQETMLAVSDTGSALTQAIFGAVTHALSCVLTLSLLAVWFPKLAVVIVAAALAMLLAASFYAWQEAKLARATLEASSRQRQTLHVLLRAVATLRVFGATERVLATWRRQLLHHTHSKVEQAGAHVSQDVLFDASPQLINLGATLWFVDDVMKGHATLGEMMLGVMLLGSVMSTLVTLASIAVRFQSLQPHFQRVDELLAESEATDAAQEAALSNPGDDGLVLDGVWFRYQQDGRWVLSNHSCRFPAHCLTELRAASGAGKTTMLRLLAGLLAPERGTVRVLGKDPRLVRGLVSYLPQQSILLEASIATNLRVLSGRGLDEALRVARHTGLSDLLQRLPMGAETIVSLAGGNLSAGQRQLILLTAAFASRSPVVLLDEPLSQLDYQASQRIHWSKLTEGRTVVLVRHD